MLQQVLIVSGKIYRILDAYNCSREFILSGKTYSHLKKYKMSENILEKINQKKIEKVDLLKKINR